MRSRTILVVILVLAVSLPLSLLLLRRGANGERPDTAAQVDRPTAGDGRSPSALEPTLDHPIERSSAPTAPALEPRVGAQPARLGSLAGRLVNARGEVVVGARVRVRRADRMQAVVLENGERARPSRAQPFETTTDERGVFRFSDLPAELSRLAVRHKGQAPYDALIVVTVAAQDLGDIALSDSVVLNGRVLDRARRAVSGATLRRLKIDASPAEILGDSPDDVVATTDDDGQFHIDELPSGPWVLLLKAAQHPDRIEKGETKSAGQVVNGLEFVLDDGAQIAGRVVNVPPALLADLWITAVPKGGSEGRVGAGEYIDEKRFLVVPRRARCAADGSFTVGELTAGLTYRLAARAGEHDSSERALTPWVEAHTGERDVELIYKPEVALVFQAVDAATSQPITEMEVRVGRSFMLPLSDETGQVRRNFPEGRVRFEKALQRPLEERAELVIEARGFTTLRVGDLRPLPERDLDLGVLRLERAPMVRVRVVDAKTEMPVAGARVALTRPAAPVSDPGAAPPVELHSPASAGSSLHEGVTGPDGRVELNSWPGETAVLIVSHVGYAVHRSAPLALERAGDRAETVALKRGGSVLLVVKDALGAVVRGELVEHRRSTPEGWTSEIGADFVSITNAHGELRFEHLSAGPHRFTASVGRASTAVSTGNSVTVEVVEGGEHTATLVVPPRARVTGRVTEGGEPLNGATLRFASGAAGETGSAVGSTPSARTNGNGEYALDGIDLGVYRVSVVHPARAMPFECEARIETARSKFDVDLPRAAIEGQVFDEEGKPVAGIAVRVEAALAPVSTGDAFALSDAAGKYVLQGVSTGSALVIVVDAGDHQPFRSNPLNVAAGEVKSGVDLRLARGAALEVLVTNAGGGIATGCRVSATSADARIVTATTNGAGRANFRGLRPGVWRIRAESATAEVEADVKLDVANTAALELR